MRPVKFVVNPDLCFLSLAEIDQINKVIKLGALFKQIQQFIRKYSGINSKLALQVAYQDGKEKVPEAKNDAEEADQDMRSDNVNSGRDSRSLVGDVEAEQEQVGVYVKAFCSGVNELLAVYKEHLLSIEAEFLRDRSLTISQL